MNEEDYNCNNAKSMKCLCPTCGVIYRMNYEPDPDIPDEYLLHVRDVITEYVTDGVTVLGNLIFEYYIDRNSYDDWYLQAISSCRIMTGMDRVYVISKFGVRIAEHEEGIAKQEIIVPAWIIGKVDTLR